MKYILRNNYSNTVIPCDSWNELADTCKSIGIDVSTVIKAKREGRETISKWELLTEDDAKSNHIFSMWKKQQEENRVLVIGDLHEPFCLDGYLEFCKGIYDKYKCNKVVFLGDVIDNHCMSYHENSLDADGINLEFEKAKVGIKKWHDIFPNAIVTSGNHDNLGVRKAKTASIGKQWIKGLAEVLETPNWKFVPHIIIDDVLYTHGTGRQASSRCLEDNISVCQGHYHSKSYVNYYVGSNNKKKFAMQVGCGVDVSSYAMSYGRDFAKPHINCGVVINGQGILEYMKLGEDK